MNLDIDLKFDMETPDDVKRRLVISVNPFSLKTAKAKLVELSDEGKTEKLLGTTEIEIGKVIAMAKKFGGGGEE